MKKIISISLITASLAFNLSAYDIQKANSLNNFYSHMTQKACANSTLFISGEDSMKMIREKKDFVFLDIRTESENSLVSLSSSNAIYIPLKNLFTKEALDKLPTDKPILIVCHSGVRATMAAMGLQQIGIKNLHVVKNGLIGLATANNPKNAPLK